MEEARKAAVAAIQCEVMNRKAWVMCGGTDEERARALAELDAEEKARVEAAEAEVERAAPEAKVRAWKAVHTAVERRLFGDEEMY